jgi:hypothetical protein
LKVVKAGADEVQAMVTRMREERKVTTQAPESGDGLLEESKKRLRKQARERKRAEAEVRQQEEADKEASAAKQAALKDKQRQLLARIEFNNMQRKQKLEEERSRQRDDYGYLIDNHLFEAPLVFPDVHM